MTFTIQTSPSDTNAQLAAFFAALAAALDNQPTTPAPVTPFAPAI